MKAGTVPENKESISCQVQPMDSFLCVKSGNGYFFVTGLQKSAYLWQEKYNV
jgi:hypothetical protein